MKKVHFLVLTFCLFPLSVQAGVTLPKIFSDNMMLQRDAPIPFWGRAQPGEKITVVFNKQRRLTSADADGKWTLNLKPEKAGGGFTLTVSGENTIEIKNVSVGEVWLCSGQSNMEWTVEQAMNAARELAAADNPNIRQFKVARAINSLPQDDIADGSWQMSNSTNTRDFTAVGYFFAREIYRELKVPVGLINASWGGTNIETWISREGFESSPEFKALIARMPRLDMAALARKTVARKTQRIEALQGVRLTAFDAEKFKQASFDDTRLPALNLPGRWEGQILGEFDGIVWMRKTVTLTAEQSRQSAVVELAQVDDNDITFINGVEVGKTDSWNVRRKYTIPSDVLREGKNVIVVKVTDTGSGGGIYGAAADMNLAFETEKIPLAGSWKFQVGNIQPGASENEFPSLAYNVMIHPLRPYAVRGVLWYQGESNAARAFQYRTAFPLLINDWRRKWNRDFPFYFVQLATFATPGDSNDGSPWAELREAQTLTLKLPQTGMVVTTDIGDPLDIHPLNKQEVSKRLAAVALRRTYGRPIFDSSPTFQSMRSVGNKIIVTFANVGGGLTTRDKQKLVKGFEIAGGDQQFYAAHAELSGNTVIVSSPQVAAPVAVRFGWLGDASANNLFNRAGFPAVPFRTDNWKTVTQDVKYNFPDVGQD